MFLLDTVALSELTKFRPNKGFTAWFDATDTNDLFISVITIGEIEHGIELQRSAMPDFAGRLEAWCDGVIGIYGERVLVVTTRIARVWGRLGGRRGNMSADLLIAATAIEHDLAVVTRNVRHFDGTGARVLNPFDG